MGMFGECVGKVFGHVCGMSWGCLRNVSRTFKDVIRDVYEICNLAYKENAKERKIAVELSQRINSLTPEVRDQIVANITYYNNFESL